jgi:hypothetical protein
VTVGGLDFARNEYIFGYAVGPRVEDVCAFAYAAQDGKQADFSPSLMLLNVSPDVIVLRYTLPVGFDPARFGASLSVWRGMTASYSQPPMAHQPIRNETNTGDVAITGIPLRFGAAYTVGLLTSASPTSLAASVSFKLS